MIPKSMLRRLLRLSRATAEHHEADKRRGEPHLIEVKLLQQVECVEAYVEATMRTRA